MTGFFLFGGILVLLLGTIITAAFRAGEDTGADLGADERRDAAIEALRDLEFEYRTGKLTEAEYRSVRASLEAEALSARDEAEGSSTPPTARTACTACGESLAGEEAFCPSCGSRTDTA